MIDFILQAWTSSLIELSGALWKLGAGNSWRPGEKLSLLFAGYNGTRNTGSDVRVEEMLRQVRRVLGETGIFAGHLSAIPVSRSAEAPRSNCLRRLDVQEQVCRCSDDHVHWRAGNCFG